MSVSTVNVIMDRISSATEESPIAVFSVSDPEKQRLDAVFGSTAFTLGRINRRDRLFLGSFHGAMDMKAVREMLNRALRA